MDVSLYLGAQLRVAQGSVRAAGKKHRGASSRLTLTDRPSSFLVLCRYSYPVTRCLSLSRLGVCQQQPLSTTPPPPTTITLHHDTSPPTRPHLRGLDGRHGWSGSGTRLGKRGHDWTPEGQGVQPRNNSDPCSLGFLSHPDQAPPTTTHTTTTPQGRASPPLRFPRTSQGRKQGHQTDL